MCVCVCVGGGGGGGNDTALSSCRGCTGVEGKCVPSHVLRISIFFLSEVLISIQLGYIKSVCQSRKVNCMHSRSESLVILKLKEFFMIVNGNII